MKVKASTGLLAGKEFYLLLWIVALLGFVFLGIIGVYILSTRTEGASISWGLLVPSYVFFALAATGSSLVNSIFAVFNVKRFKPVIKRGVWLSLMLIIPAVIFIILDLGKWTQAYNLYFLFNITSRVGWMGWLYIAFVLYLVMELIVIIREEYMPRWAPMVTGILVLIATLAVHTNLGALFGGVSAKPLWYNHLLPLQFIVSAITAGAAFQVIFMSIISHLKTESVAENLRKLFSSSYRPLLIGLIIINFVLMAIKYIPGLFSTETAPYVRLLLAGPYSFNFWGLEIVLGGIVPLILLLHNKTKNSAGWMLTASALIVIGVYFSKYDLLIGGQSIGPVFTTDYISYFAHGADFLLLVGGIGASLLLYTLGELLFPLDQDDRPSWFIFIKRGA
ncbi:MAG: polysulfide reductase NrfD [Dehalococcoidales bacterium]|nr:MAG: polysulfide reductase NrfD [Dehalococcoidales bacterium]